MLKEKDISTGQKQDFPELKQVVDTLKFIFEDLRNEASTSSTLLDLNIHSTFSKMINEAIEDPLTTGFQGLKAIEMTVAGLINESVKSYFETVKRYIKNAFKRKTKSNVLHYSIILKNNNLENRSKLYEFLTSYEKTEYNTRFPILFQFIPESLEKDFQKEIKTNNFEQII